MTVFGLIKTLFQKGDSGVYPVDPSFFPAPKPTTQTLGRKPAQAVSADAISKLISQKSGASQSLMAGSFELVGLDEIKEALGSRWATLAARATELAEQGIRRRLGDADVLQVLSETEFSICFAKLGREAAVERAKQISREIKQEIFAELPEFSSSVTVKQYVAEIELQNLAGDTGSLADRLVLTLRRMRLEADRAILNYRTDDGKSNEDGID